MSRAGTTHGRDVKYKQHLIGKPEWKIHIGDLDLDGRIILKRKIKESVGRVQAGFIRLRIGTSGGLY
jgi:hypothetical protein